VLQAFLNMFKIADLRNKLLFTVGMLIIYRIGFWIPLPGIDQQALVDAFERMTSDQGNAMGQVVRQLSIFTGGNLGQSTLFGLGIMPYISAAIIFQLLGTVVPALENLKKEGPAGQQKIQEYTRYATVGLCIVQATFWLASIGRITSGEPIVYPDWRGSMLFWMCGITGLTAGTIFLMWLGEQIDKYGIGNGASLIITAGILAQMPSAVAWVAGRFEFSATATEDQIGPIRLAALIAAFVLVVGGTVLVTQGQRRIPVRQAKQTRGRRVFGGQESYLPLKVNHGGVMPIIFAASMLMVPMMLFRWMSQAWPSTVTQFLGNEFQMGQYLYELTYIILIYFFAYFWTTVQFQPRDISIQLRDHGSFVPGLRPGPRTAEYLERVMERITFVGAGFLAFIAVVPSVVAAALDIDMFVTSFLGGTALLIAVSVVLDFIQRVEANLKMRNYAGFLGDERGSGPRIRGPRG